MKSTLFLVPLLWLCTPLMNTGTDAQKKPAQREGHQSFRLFNPDTMAKPTVGYSQVAEVAGGKTIYVAGQVALDASGTLVGKDDFRAQVDQVFKNINAAVQAAGGDFHSVIKLNYFCAESVDAAQIPSLREIRDKYVDTAHTLRAFWRRGPPFPVLSLTHHTVGAPSFRAVCEGWHSTPFRRSF